MIEEQFHPAICLVWGIYTGLFIKKYENGDFGILAHTYYPNPTGLDHSKNQKKYVLTRGSGVVTHHVWYLTGREVEDKVIDNKLNNRTVCATKFSILMH
jgi:hypothetical protein